MKLTVKQLTELRRLIDLALVNAPDKREFAQTAMTSSMIMEIIK